MYGVDPEGFGVTRYLADGTSVGSIFPHGTATIQDFALAPAGLQYAAMLSFVGNGSQVELHVGVVWRAETGFAFLGSSAAYGGMIVTDWYSGTHKPDERCKGTVYSLDSRLRGDALKVTVFKEVSNGQGGWVPSQAADQTSIDIENAILTRARQLRVSNLHG